MRILKNKIELSGQGLHSGKICNLKIEPCESDKIILNGLEINKFELDGSSRGSDYIFPDGTKIRTCEHVLSALTGCGIWFNVKINVDGGEMPALDGCAELLSGEILKNSETVSAENKNKILRITKPIIIRENNKRFVAAFPTDDSEEKLLINYMVEYDYIGAQILDFEYSPENYIKNISRARTFAYERDINYLRSHGMAMGGNLENAILVGEKITASGGLRWPDEFVRHKILDLIGDLTAVGVPIYAHIIALRAGHDLHLKLAKKIREEII